MNITIRVVSLLVVVAATRAAAAEPEIRALTVRGLQVGGTTTLTLDGDGLGKEPKLHLPFPAKATLKAPATDKQATFDVALGNDVIPGYYHLRLITEGGITAPVVVAVDRLPQVPFTPTIDALPIALHGTLAGSKPLETTVTGKAGQKLMLEVEAQRLGSKLRPVLHLIGPRNLQVSWSWGVPLLQGDTRLEATLPEDGSYRITLHDAEYAAPAPGYFRLRVGQWDYVDRTFPPVITTATKSVELIGNRSTAVKLPGGNPGRWSSTDWPADGNWSGPRPVMELSNGMEVVEQAEAKLPQELPAAAVSVSGRLSAAFEEDRYLLPVTPGSKWRIEVMAERLGSPADPSLIIRNEAGTDLQRVEDGPGSLDPLVEYAVPDKVTALVLAIADTQGRGNPKGIYRVIITPLTAGASRGDFELTTTTARVFLNGRTVLPILAERKGYDGPITLKLLGLPDGVKAAGLTIPGGADGTLVTLTGNGKPIDLSLIRILGEGEGGLSAIVVQKNHPMERLQPWLATELALAGPTAVPESFEIAWKPGKADDFLLPARKLALPVTLKNIGKPTSVKLTLITSQGPKFQGNTAQIDVNRSLRMEKAIELPATATEGEVVALIPGDLSNDSYDFCVKAEALAADKKTVLATAYTDVRQLPVKLPIAIRLDSDKPVEVKPGGTIEIAGSIERIDPMAGDVLFAITGLPTGARLEPLTVKAADKAFKVKLTFPPATPPGNLKGVKLSGSILPDAKLPQQRVRSREIELPLRAVPATKK